MSKPLEIEGMVQLVLDKVLGCRSPGPSRALSWLVLSDAEVELLPDDLRLFSGYFWQILAISWLILANSQRSDCHIVTVSASPVTAQR